MGNRSKFNSPLEKFNSHLIKLANGCHILNTRPTHGYSQFGYKKVTYLAHRFIYEVLYGSVGSLHLHHKCEYPRCVNPEHLIPVDAKEHMLTHKNSRCYNNTLKTHCPRGHEYSEINTYIDTVGSRHCKICRKNRIILFNFINK